MRAVAALALFSAAFASTSSALTIVAREGLEDRELGSHHDGPHHHVHRSVPAPAVAPTKWKGLTWMGGSTDVLKHFTNHGIDVVYNWQPVAPSGLGNYDMQGACQLWGTKSIAEFEKVRPQYKYLFGPNEFNLGQPSGSGLSVSEVVSIWKKYIQPYCGGPSHYCVAPSVTSAPSGLGLMKQFFNEVGGFKGSKANAISLHLYETNINNLKNYVNEMHSGLGDLDVWITEFACQGFSGGNGDCSNSEAEAFMKEVLAFCKETSWIKVCMPFGVGTGSQVKQWGVSESAAFLTSSGELTALGQIFVDYE